MHSDHSGVGVHVQILYGRFVNCGYIYFVPYACLHHSAGPVPAVVEAALGIYDKTTDRRTPIRRLGICFENICDEGCEGYNLFTDFEAVERERALQHTIIGINQRYGKNAVLNGVNYMPEGTQRERNGFIGGHRAGYDDERRKS